MTLTYFALANDLVPDPGSLFLESEDNPLVQSPPDPDSDNNSIGDKS
jgi:hypothetical protein